MRKGKSLAPFKAPDGIQKHIDDSAVEDRTDEENEADVKLSSFELGMLHHALVLLAWTRDAAAASVDQYYGGCERGMFEAQLSPLRREHKWSLSHRRPDVCR